MSRSLPTKIRRFSRTCLIYTSHALVTQDESICINHFCFKRSGTGTAAKPPKLPAPLKTCKECAPSSACLASPSSSTHFQIRVSFVCTCANHCLRALFMVHQNSLINAHSVFLTIQRSQNIPNAVVIRKSGQCPVLSGFWNFTQLKGAIVSIVTYIHSFFCVQVVLL